MSIRATAPKEICWNDIKLEIPPNLEVIVSGEHHLLFEIDFQPILEIRWDSSSKNRKNLKIEKIIQRMEKEFGRQVATVQLPNAILNNHVKYETTWLSWQDDHRLSGAILRCRSCNTLFLIRFLSNHTTQRDTAFSVISSLDCHASNGNGSVWSIQDLRIIIPKSHLLQNYNLAPGLTRLTFSSPGNLLHICRIAPARERLKKQKLTVILKTLLNKQIIENYTVKKEHTIEIQHHPTIFSQIIIRLRRQKPFCWARLWHNVERDRLQGVIMESIRPIDTEILQEVCENYAILPST